MAKGDELEDLQLDSPVLEEQLTVSQSAGSPALHPDLTGTTALIITVPNSRLTALQPDSPLLEELHTEPLTSGSLALYLSLLKLGPLLMSATSSAARQHLWSEDSEWKNKFCAPFPNRRDLETLTQRIEGALHNEFSDVWQNQTTV